MGGGVLLLPRSPPCWGQRTRRMNCDVARSERNSVVFCCDRGLRRFDILELVRECFDRGRDGESVVGRGSEPLLVALEATGLGCALSVMADVCWTLASLFGHVYK